MWRDSGCTWSWGKRRATMGHDWDWLLTCQSVGMCRKHGSGFELQGLWPERLFSKEELKSARQGPRTCTAAPPTSREDCGYDLLPISAPGWFDQRSAKWGGVLDPAWHSGEEWRVQAAVCWEGNRLGTVHLRLSEPRVGPLPWGKLWERKMEPSPPTQAGQGKFCKNSWTSLTTCRELFFKSKTARLMCKRTYFERETKYTGS